MFILNPYRYSATSNLLLDTYSGAAAAYSLRKLRTAYSGSAIRVRRSNDNTEQDIGFDLYNNLDEVSLLTFCGENLLQYSDDLSNAYYNNQTRVTSVSNTTETTDPFGTNLSEKYTSSTTSAGGAYFGKGAGGITTASGTFYFSLYAKKGNSNIIALLLGDGTNYITRYFNINTGTVLSQVLDGSNWTNTGADISNAGNGWWRCHIYGTRTTTTQLQIYALTDCLADLNSTCTSGNYNYFFGAQINLNSLKQYSPTTTFTKDGNGFVTKWYDQSGNVRDASQTTSANQPRIVNAGTIDKVNNKPSCFFDGTNDLLSTTSISITGNASIYLASYKTNNCSVIYARIFANNNYTLDCGFQRFQYKTGVNSFIDFTNQNTNVLNLSSYYRILNGTCEIFRNGISNSTGSLDSTEIGTSSLYLGNRGDLGTPLCGYISEIVFYNSNNYTSRTNIESNINSYYSIY